MKDSHVIAIQARTGSTRLPGKMTRPFHDGRTILQLMLDELLSLFDGQSIVVATSDNPADDQIAEMVADQPVLCTRGSEDDVLRRVFDAVEAFESRWVVRVCADNPLLRAKLVSDLLSDCDAQDWDYASYRLPDGTPSILSHFGLFAEVIRGETLARINRVAVSPRHREHLTSHILDHQSQYQCHFIDIPSCLTELDFVRLTVDTQTDFEVCQGLYADVTRQFGSRFSVENLVSVIHDRPEIHTRMAGEIAANSKR